MRYPRGEGVEHNSPATPFTLGQSRSIRVGEGAVLLNFGTLLPAAEQIANQFNLGLIDMRFVKPLDETRLIS